MTKVSIIIPVYNVERYIEQCLDSVFLQTFQDFEIICVDDGSIDNSLNILKKYNDKRLKIIQTTHSGAGIARNIGLKSSCGEYIQFLDADDYAKETLLEKMISYANESDADIIVCSYKKVDNSGNVIERRNPNSPINLALTPLKKCFNKYDFKNDIFSLLTPVPWNKLYKRDLLIKNNIEFPKLNICEDIAFVDSAIAVADKIYVIDDELINYRFNRNGSMATYRNRYTIDVVYSCLELKRFLKDKGIYNDFEKAFIKAFKNHIRWEIALCSDDEYKDFLSKLKELMPNDWRKFNSALKKDYITLDYLNKFIGDKKVFLWGASFFIQKILNNEKYKNSNILGIIDKNEASWGKDCGNYKIFSPDIIKKTNPDGILMSIWSNYEEVYPLLKKELAENYPNVELLPNIFEEELV